MNLNRLLLEQRLVLLNNYLRELKQLARVERQGFVSDKVKTAAAESYLRRSFFRSRV